MRARYRVLLAVSFLLGAALFSGACDDDATSPYPCGKDYRPTERPPRNLDRVSITQGIWGDVWFWDGNFMPPCGSGTVTAVGREMRIYELARIGDVVSAGGGFFEDVHTPLVATVWSDAQGFFQMALPPGDYSVFSVEDSLLYANRFDGSGAVYPVEVRAGEVTGIRFDIDYKAYW